MESLIKLETQYCIINFILKTLRFADRRLKCAL